MVFDPSINDIYHKCKEFRHSLPPAPPISHHKIPPQHPALDLVQPVERLSQNLFISAPNISQVAVALDPTTHLPCQR